jgi:hypothetical protein
MEINKKRKGRAATTIPIKIDISLQLNRRRKTK